MSKGLFITLEGSEGSGKSTQVTTIKEFLESKGRKVLTLREPGGTPIAEDIRKILKTSRDDDNLCDKAELLLMYAARAQLVDTLIKPTLDKGIDVVCDRHDLSTIAYQGGGRGIDMSILDSLRNIVLGDFRPDATIILDVDPKVGMTRAQKRGALDRFEQSKMDFFVRVRDTYLDYAKKHQDNVFVVNGEDNIETVKNNVIKIVENLDAIRLA